MRGTKRKEGGEKGKGIAGAFRKRGGEGRKEGEEKKKFVFNTNGGSKSIALNGNVDWAKSWGGIENHTSYYEGRQGGVEKKESGGICDRQLTRRRALAS